MSYTSCFLLPFVKGEISGADLIVVIGGYPPLQQETEIYLVSDQTYAN
jgi:hypothetical protein